MTNVAVKLQTEQLNTKSIGIDAQPSKAVLRELLAGQISAAKSVESAVPEIEAAAIALTNTLSSSNKIIYVAAGSSALMAIADGLELPGTYGISNDNIRIVMAGGAGSLTQMLGGPEDDRDQGGKDVADAGMKRGDCVICLSASGSTPYVLGAIEVAKAEGATVVGIANNPDTPLLNEADISIFLPTPPEVIAGSTRMGAGTAQKVALNMMSTLMAIQLGHVHDGHMVNLQVENLKLQKRAQGMVRSIADCDEVTANAALRDADGNVKLAVLLASGAKDTKQGTEILERNGHKLRPSLSEL
ncbi:N-acetylmuramic acid 6-phosphate etherase [Lentilitoribacter sp. Alg239-R112]|uniref:N-acetylmuramic acid 6-phosphate etherase n=1 Tax=Lentilitoribacter sp. Alg239-R112 TaxID=2305987 RepID=UPI0013A6A0F1|nr:N-acetylmuramic acid 6-phosphate etherase [Lentilitoribacter sp. Alg239-R112]